MRKDRKREHIEKYLNTLCQGQTLLDDVYLSYNALPDLDFNEVDLGAEFLGRKFSLPIMINAMTGGSDLTRDINSSLGQLARDFNIPMAVGSQTIALDGNKEARRSFKVARDKNPDGVIISNLSASASLDEAKIAMEIVEADAIQLHLNPGHEMAMEEGDRDFRGVLENIGRLVEELDRPVIVKEVGLGISKEVYGKLLGVGVEYIDISGSGGTNFLEIENLRCSEIDMTDLYCWGIPTALALLECREIAGESHLIASGGIRTAVDVAKALVIGADQVAIAGEILSYLMHGGYERAENYLEELAYKLKIIMVLLGKRDLGQLKNSKFRLKGELKDLYRD